MTELVNVNMDQSVDVLTDKIYDIGEYVADLVKVPVDANIYKISTNKVLWPTGGNVVEVVTEISLDGGQTFELLVSFICDGQESIHPITKELITESFVTWPLPNPKNGNRVLRTTLRVLQTAKTAVTVMAGQINK